jgi:hypothetical protein
MTGFVILQERMRRESSGHTRKELLSKCVCGHTAWRNAGNILSGKSTKCKSCANKKDGLSDTPEYAAWCSMKHRCLNEHSKVYKDYGGRGITIDKSWLVFTNFLADMGMRPTGFTLERVDNSKGYCKENCVWAPRCVQQANRRCNRVYTFNGKTQHLAAWARDLNISQSALSYRLNNRWTVEKSFTVGV